MPVINKTPHAVHIVGADNSIVHTYPKAESLIRLSVSTRPAEPLPDGTPTSITVFGEPEGLPMEQWIAGSQGNPETGYGNTPSEAEDDFCAKTGRGYAMWTEPLVYYIVSQIVKSALPNRADLLVPAEVVRDNAGNIIGCKSLGR